MNELPTSIIQILSENEHNLRILDNIVFTALLWPSNMAGDKEKMFLKRYWRHLAWPLITSDLLRSEAYDRYLFVQVDQVLH